MRHPPSRGKDPELQGVSPGMVPGFIRPDHAMPATDLLGTKQKPDQCEGFAASPIRPLHVEGAAVDFSIPTAFWMGLQTQLRHQGCKGGWAGSKHEREPRVGAVKI